jgi:hypothetical protein
MDDDKQITQRRFGVALKFEFGPESLSYSMQDSSGQRQFSVDYVAINCLSPSKLVLNNRQFAQRLLAIPIAAAVASIALTGINKGYSDGFGVLAGALLVLLLIANSLKVFAIKYTMIQMAPSPPGAGNHSIRIIDDKNHSTILSEIRRRWRARIRQLHFKIDFSNPLDRELARFKWMKDKEVITEDEHREVIEKLQAYAAHSHQLSSDNLIN